MDRKVWVIELDGLPVACGVAAPQGYPLIPTPGHAVTWYGPGLREAQIGSIRALASLLRATADAARTTAYSDGTHLGLRPVFAGRSDGFAVASDWLSALATELASGKAGPLTAELTPESLLAHIPPPVG